MGGLGIFYQGTFGDGGHSMGLPSNKNAQFS
jgi:hypothetical protein